jgi:hypothetical protein
MQCQSTPGPSPTPPRRIRVTDQALVAIAAARRSAAGRGPATVVDLLVGLAIEPDGEAGPFLRGAASGVADLLDRSAAAAAWAPPLEVALRWASAESPRRALTTLDLLLAALEVGGSNLADLLERCAIDLTHVTSSAGGVETFGAGSGGGLTPAAELVAARVRATDGRAIELLFAVAALAGDGLPDYELLEAAVPLLDQGGTPTEAWNAELTTVLDAARELAAPEPADLLDLLRATLVAGGSGPRQLAAVAAELELAEGTTP